jgi:hypothetical protein
MQRVLYYAIHTLSGKAPHNMATHALILTNNGTLYYRHFDGYPASTGDYPRPGELGYDLFACTTTTGEVDPGSVKDCCLELIQTNATYTTLKDAVQHSSAEWVYVYIDDLADWGVCPVALLADTLEDCPWAPLGKFVEDQEIPAGWEKFL